MRNVLVTGVGAIIGYGALNALRKSRYPLRIVGADIYPHAVGQHWCDAFERAVLTSDPRYGDFLRGVIAKHRIDLVLPAIEQDVTFLSAHRDEFPGTALALNDAALVALTDDKWTTREALSKLGLPTIDSAIDGDFDTLAERLGVPFLLKPRRSYASKGIVAASTAEDFVYWRKKMGAGFMAQRIVGDAESEFTAAAFGYGDGTASKKMVFQRWLAQDGSTVRARLVREPDLEAQMDVLVGAFRPRGPTNFQFRRHEGRFCLLEINARISSSTSLRAGFGMNEAEMCIAHYLDGERPDFTPMPAGIAIRYIADHVVPGRADF